MKKSLNVLYFLTLPVIAIGGIYLVMQVAMLYLAWTHRDPGMDIAEAAAAASSSMKGVVIGILVVIAAFAARAVINRKLKAAE